MKRTTVASLKKVTTENLEALGPARLAVLLLAAAEGRPELKRKLRLELAAAQGPDHLAPEIDKRLASLATSRSKISWRARPAFMRDVDALRDLIAGRLAELDRPGALDRLWLFMALARPLEARARDKHGDLAAVFERASLDIGSLVAALDEAAPVDALVDALVEDPSGWRRWLPVVLNRACPTFAALTLQRVSERGGMPRSVLPLVRMLADVAGEVDAYLATFEPEELRVPAKAADAARRLLAAGRIEEAGGLLRAAAPAELSDRSKTKAIDPEWEGAWIDFLEQTGEDEAAQTVRWAAFQRTLSVERARSFVSRLADFDDVEAEGRALAYAAAHRDFVRGLSFLMDWPAIPEAAAMIKARSEEAAVAPEKAELWAGRLRARQPAAAGILLRKAAAAAFRRRELATCNRLSQEADALDAS